MIKVIFHTQIVILGLIDHIFDVLKNDQNRKEIRDNLLAGIHATFLNELLKNSPASEILNKVVLSIPTNIDFKTGIETVSSAIDKENIEIDITPHLKKSAIFVLNDFVSKTNRPELKEVIEDTLA